MSKLGQRPWFGLSCDCPASDLVNQELIVYYYLLLLNQVSFPIFIIIDKVSCVFDELRPSSYEKSTIILLRYQKLTNPNLTQPFRNKTKTLISCRVNPFIAPRTVS